MAPVHLALSRFGDEVAARNVIVSRCFGAETSWLRYFLPHRHVDTSVVCLKFCSVILYLQNNPQLFLLVTFTGKSFKSAYRWVIALVCWGTHTLFRLSKFKWAPRVFAKAKECIVSQR